MTQHAICWNCKQGSHELCLYPRGEVFRCCCGNEISRELPKDSSCRRSDSDRYFRGGLAEFFRGRDERHAAHVNLVVNQLQSVVQQQLGMFLGTVNYPAKTSNLIQRVDPSEPKDMFYLRGLRKHLQAYKEIWKQWEEARKAAKSNLDKIEKGYSDFETAIKGQLAPPKVTLSPLDHYESGGYVANVFRTSLLFNLRAKYVDGKEASGPVASATGDTFRVTWDNGIIAEGGKSQCETLADIGNELLKSDKMGTTVKEITIVQNAHEAFKAETSTKLWTMIDQEIISPVKGGFEKLKGKCDAC